MKTTEKRDVVFLPGILLPAAVQYEPLLSILKDDVHPLLKDLEIYNEETPPPEYQFNMEVEGLKQAVDAAGLQTFHLVGYSGGGAVALAFAGTYPDRMDSLALSEPAVIPSQEWMHQEAGFFKELYHVVSLPPTEQMREFMRLELRPGVSLPSQPQGDPPPWMARRPAGLRTMARSFSSFDLPLERLHQFHKPVYLAVGALSNSIQERKAETLAKLFSDFRVEVYKNRHHFDPPQRAEPERFARALNDLWQNTSG
jgi:pimeloyl-ACP methyl ester carboxylesterase